MEIIFGIGKDTADFPEELKENSETGGMIQLNSRQYMITFDEDKEEQLKKIVGKYICKKYKEKIIFTISLMNHGEIISLMWEDFYKFIKELNNFDKTLYEIAFSELKNYFFMYKTLNIDGFVKFRITNHIKEIENSVEEAYKAFLLKNLVY